MIRSIVRGACAIAAALPLLVVHGPTASAATAGFSDTKVADLRSATTVEWLPNGRIAVLEKAGRLLVGSPGGPLTERLALDVCTQSERGLLGLAADPGFLSNGWLYVYYTRPAPGAPGGCVNRLSRFSMPNDGAVVRSTELVLLDNISSRAGNHNGGALEVGGDGYLYVGVGDAGTDPRQRSGSNRAAQDLSLLNGKVLRVTTDGRPAPGNPLLGQPGVTTCATRGNLPSTPLTPCAEIFAWGLRNPWRLAFDRDAPGGAVFHINDVGQGTYEEVNRGAAGNFGWPDREGPCPQGSTVPCAAPASDQLDPLTAYGRALGTYITAGAFVPAGGWPGEFGRSYLFGDGGSGQIWILRPNGTVDYGAPFATGANGLTDMTFGFDAGGAAALYYTTGSALRMIRSTATPQAGSGAASVFVAEAPRRAYDTQNEGGSSRLAAGSTRLISTGAPVGATAALVNLTMADAAGSGYLRVWVPGGVRPTTSALNVDAGAVAANASIVPVDAEGRFVLETSVAARVIVDVTGAFVTAAGASSAGRFVPLGSVRLADTRLPAGAANSYTAQTDGWTIGTERGGFPTGSEISAYVVSVAAIAEPGQPAGWVGAYPGGATYDGTSNVNVAAYETRANLVVVPADGTGRIGVRERNVDDVVVDVLGYFTGTTAPSAESGQFRLLIQNRSVDTRIDAPFDRLTGGITSSLAYYPTSPTAAVVQNVTVVGPSAAGWLSAHPGRVSIPGVSSVNYDAAGQTRAALAFTQLGDENRVGFTSKANTDLVVDVLGSFSR